MTCDICQDGKYVCLPIYRSASELITNETIPTTPVISHRTFKCPQCCEKQIADECVQTLGVSITVPERMSDHAKELMHKEAALSLANHMLRNDAIRFTSERRADGYMELIGTVATVTQNQIERIETKERRAAVKYGARLVSRACEKIALWGSSFQRETVHKDEAYRFIREAAAELERV